MTMLVRESDGTIREDVELRFGYDAAAMELSIGDETISVPAHPGDRPDAHWTMQKLGEKLAESGRQLIGCGTCARFQFSGMSRDMSAGTVGYCLRVGHRVKGGMVEITHRCGEHVYNEGWECSEAWNEEPVMQRRGAAHREARVSAFEGAMVGLAVGDALGFPCEFRSRDQIVASFPPNGVDGFVALHDPRWQGGVFIAGKEHPPGTFSDDTQMSLAVADGLLDVPSGEFDELMPAIAVRFVEWSRSDDNDRAPGSTCMTGCQNLAAGMSLRSAGVADSKGAGAPMRVVPIGLRFGRDREQLLKVARASSVLTHGHPAAIESSAAVALAVSLALYKQTPKTIHAALLEECGAASPELRRRLQQVPALLDAPPELALGPEGLGESWVAEEAVASALWCFWRSPADFRRTVLTAVNTIGDSDTIGCIAGGISGAFNGLDAIPREWREGIEDGARLRETGRRLHDLR
ncbi:MAG: hypothetical protein DRJ42_29515 [Deltaproteobacteria bacterium]|nr:MAG: hypothetical protein DRJ42_29515 [Deltaproteobacteria bacterium]